MLDLTTSMMKTDARLRLFVFVVLYLMVFSARAQVANEHLDSVINTLELKEVVVKAQKIQQRGDTISFTASSYIKKDDKVLEDLLKKMPGIEVTSDGQIKYNGQWINEFYIEGADMIGDNYSAATKNIDAQAIGTVEIMENHQDRKILQGTQRGSAPAMNIRLKQTSKGVWSSTLSAALGARHDFSRDISLTLMNFQRKLQNLSVLKTNNVGTNLRQEVHSTDNSESVFGTGIVTPSKPRLPDMYVYDNNSYSASVNQLVKVDDEKTLTFNVNYLYDKENQVANDVTTYFTGDKAIKVISEQNKASLRQHYLGGHVGYKQNASSFYLKNNLSFNLSLPDNYGIINNYILQNLSGHYISIDNNLTANYKRKNGGVSDTNLRVSYTDKTGNMVVDSVSLSENVHQQFFTMNGTTSLVSVQIPHLMFNLNAEVKANWHKASTVFRDLSTDGNDILATWLLGSNVVPKFLFHFNSKFQFLFYVPLGIKYYYSNDEAAKSYAKTMFAAEPYSNVTYRLSDKLALEMTTIYSEDMSDALSLMIKKRYLNYRSTISNPDSIKAWRNRSFRTTLTTSYKDVIRMLFGNITFSYAYTRNGSSLDYEFKDRNVVDYVTTALPTSSKVWQIGQSLSKGFFWWKAKISESLTLGTVNTEYYLSQIQHNGRNDYLQANLSFTAQPVGWLNFSSSNDGELIKVYTDGKDTGTKYFTFSNKTSLTLWPLKQLCLASSLQYNYNDYFDEGRHNVFLNCSAEYYLKDIMLFVKCNNLFDRKEFRRINDNGVMRYVSEYSLCGRTLMLGLRIKLT